VKPINDTIFKVERNFSPVLDSDRKVLIEAAKNTDRYRSRILYHPSEDSVPQHMLICFDKRSVVEVSTHKYPESFTLIEGVAQYRFYDKAGIVETDVRMSPAHVGGVFFVHIDAEVPHRFFAFTDGVIANEVGYSSFAPENTKFGTDGGFSIANDDSMAHVAEQRLTINNQTVFEEIDDQNIGFSSNSGVSQISKHDLISFLDSKQRSMAFRWAEKVDGLNKELEALVAFLPGESFSWSGKNISVHLLDGEGLTVSSAQGSQMSTLSQKKQFAVIGCGENVTMSNNSSQIVIVHLTNA
jgi:cupin fold WbuC family metalloprotein